MIVIEERRSFLEKNIRDALFHSLPQDEAADLSARLFGKAFPPRDGGEADGIPELRGLNPSVLAQMLIPLIKATEEIPAELRNGRLTRRAGPPPQGQQAASCAGASIDDRRPPHAHVLPRLPAPRQLARPCWNSARTSPTPIHGSSTTARARSTWSPTATPAATPCSCSPPPNSSCTTTAAWASAAAPGSGIDPFITNKQIVFMGDGTFFHSRPGRHQQLASRTGRTSPTSSWKTAPPP